MIPPAFREVWRTGIETGDYYLKLCGSGGWGGLYFGFHPRLRKGTKTN